MKLIMDIFHSILRRFPALRSKVGEKASACLIALINRLG